MITEIEMEAMGMFVDQFQNKPGFEREHYALGAMQDMLAAMDSDKIYLMTAEEKKAFVKEFADAVVGERERVAEETKETRWVCVYKDTLASHAENDNLVNIQLPSEWLYKALKAEGVEDIEAWFDEYTADGTDSIARRALGEGVILGCDDEYVMAVITFEKEHPELVERAEAVQEWLEELGEDIPEGLGFEFKGMHINNPFYDESMRFDVSPFAYYGAENMTVYLQQAEGIMHDAYKSKIDEAVRALFYVDENKTIELYADYRDTSEFLHKTLIENANSPELESIIRDKIWESYSDGISDCEDKVLEGAGVVGTEFEDNALEYLRDNYSFEPPYDHFMKDEMKVNILLATPEEKNSEYTNIAYSFKAMASPDDFTNPEECVSSDTMLKRLIEQQGHSFDELQAILKDYNDFFYDEENACVREHFSEDGRQLKYDETVAEFKKSHNVFLTSVCQELENQNYDMGVLTVLARVTVEDYIKMQSPGTEVTMSKDSMIGIYNPWNGSGSVLEIELEKDFVFSTEMVRNMQIEGVKPAYEYTVDDTYGLIGSCWKEPVAVEKVEQKKTLDDVIRSCEAVSKKASDEHENKMVQMPGTEGDWGKKHWGSDKTDR